MLPPLPVLSPGLPRWAQGVDLWYDYTQPRGSQALGFPPATDTHASSIYAPSSFGVYQSFAANVPVRTNLGLQTVPTRTNLCTYSSTFFNTAWGKSSGMAVADNTIVAPDGTTTASALTGGSADSSVNNAITPIASTTYTVSVWLKVPSGTLSINMYLNGGGILVHLSCALTTSWQRFTVTGTTSTTASMALQIGGANRWGNGVVIHAWNGQTEVGAFASPPIPTTSAAVTVNGNQQVIDLTGRLGTGVAGVFKFTFRGAIVNITHALHLSDATVNNSVALTYLTSGNKLSFTVDTGGVGQALVDILTAPVDGTTYTVAFAAQSNYAMAQVVGQSAPTADTTVSWPSGMGQIAIGGSAGAATTTRNVFQTAKALTLSFGAQDATTFAAALARAQILAAAA